MAVEIERESLPEHDTPVCPQCGYAGVTIRGDQCDCHGCDYRWRWPLMALES